MAAKKDKLRPLETPIHLFKPTSDPNPPQLEVTNDVALPETKEVMGRYLPDNIYAALSTYLESRPLGEVKGLYDAVKQLPPMKVTISNQTN